MPLQMRERVPVLSHAYETGAALPPKTAIGSDWLSTYKSPSGASPQRGLKQSGDSKLQINAAEFVLTCGSCWYLPQHTSACTRVSQGPGAARQADSYRGSNCQGKA